jgi:hypothetical protein
MPVRVTMLVRVRGLRLAFGGFCFGASIAEAYEGDLVTFEGEASGCEVPEVSGAAFDLEKA